MPRFETPNREGADVLSEAIDAVAAQAHGSVSLILSGLEHGQHSFAAHTSRALSRSGLSAAIIDANVENSQIGYPGTIAVAWADVSFERLNELPVVSEYFVGSFSARSIALELTAAVARAIQFARAAGAARILVELSEIDSSAASRRLLAALTQVVAPAMIATTSEYPQAEEALRIASTFCPAATLTRLESDTDFTPMPMAQRKLLARTRLFRALGAGTELLVSLDDRGTDAVYTLNTRLGTELGLQPHLRRWISEAIRANVVRAELTPRRSLDLYVVESGARARGGSTVDQAAVAEHFNVATVREISLAQIIGAYVGLLDENGKLVGIGRIAGLREQTQELIVTSSAAASHRVKIVQFGSARIAADGSVLDDRS